MVEPVPLALVDCEAVPLADWSPVVVVAVWPEVWFPVVVFAVVLTDWSPVVVALSIVRLERPRRSMFGLKVDVEPVTEVFTSVEEPVMVELCEVDEPVTDGLAVALPEAVTPVVAAWLVDAPAVLGMRPPGCEAACDSGMQSTWTGLEERSLAMPVPLSACLPAFGWFKSLHNGLVAVVFVDAVALVAVFALSVNCAQAGAAPTRAAAVRAVRCRTRIIAGLL